MKSMISKFWKTAIVITEKYVYMQIKKNND